MRREDNYRAASEADSVHIYPVSKWKQAPDERPQNIEATHIYSALQQAQCKTAGVRIDNRISIDGMRILRSRGRKWKRQVQDLSF